jgi:peptidoglycan hydrolase CwlO-like protein
MSRQIINNTPANSGSGDNLKVAFDKVNAMTTEIYTILSALQVVSGGTITSTSDLTNDGESGTPFITESDIPTSWNITDITNLSSTLSSIQTQINNIITDLNNDELDIAALQTDMSNLSSTITSLSSTILSQNNTISQINLDIVSIKNRLNALENI